jgi:ribosomal protein S2
MDDMEKGRVLHVMQMEQTIEHFKAEYERYKTTAELWEPVVTVETNTAQMSSKIGLKFGGKTASLTVTNEFLAGMDLTGATSQITDALVDALVRDRLASVIRTEVERLQKNAISTSGAGKW